MTEHSLQLNGKTFFYRQSGSNGPALVLLHGFGEDGGVWQAQMNAFADYNLLVPDLPGSGRSELTANQSMEGLAETVYQWLETIGVQKCILIGHSMGGYIALAFAEKWSDRLQAFGLFHSTAHADSEEKRETRRKGIAFIQQHGAAAFLQTMVPNLYAPATREKNPVLVEQHLSLANNFLPQALVSYYEGMMQRPDRTGVLRSSSLPVLLLAGRHDGVIPPEDAYRLASMPRLSYIHVLKQSGHMGMVEEPEETNRLVNQFLHFVETHTTTP